MEWYKKRELRFCINQACGWVKFCFDVLDRLWHDWFGEFLSAQVRSWVAEFEGYVLHIFASYCLWLVLIILPDAILFLISGKSWLSDWIQCILVHLLDNWLFDSFWCEFWGGLHIARDHCVAEGASEYWWGGKFLHSMVWFFLSISVCGVEIER